MLFNLVKTSRNCCLLAVSIGLLASSAPMSVAADTCSKASACESTSSVTTPATTGATSEAATTAATTETATATPEVTGETNGIPNRFQLKVELKQEHFVNPGQRLEDLVAVALAKDEEAQNLAGKNNTKHRAAKTAGRRLKAMTQFVTSYQGFESSSEAADVILSEKLKLKHHHAIEYVHQKKLDELHTQLFAAMMQMAQGVGQPDPAKKQKSIASALSALEPLVGTEEAGRTLAIMERWVPATPSNTSVADAWDVMETQSRCNDVLKTSLKDDTVVKAIEARLHKFNHRSNFARASAKIVNTSLSVIMLSPTIISPAAQFAQLVFVALTGGPEEEKLLKEVYLDRCFESRFKRLNAEASLAVNNYNMAVLTKNVSLQACTESLISSMVGPDQITAIVGTALVAPPQTPVQHKEVTLLPEKEAKKLEKAELKHKDRALAKASKTKSASI